MSLESAARPSTEIASNRSAWMSVLANASWVDFRDLWRGETPPDFTVLRQPEAGLVMLRGRIGGTGGPFNIGEMTVTRCAVKLSGGATGHAYVMGRDKDHATAAAICDAMLQEPAHHDGIMHRIVMPLAARRAEQRRAAASKSAATKVDFFTLVRGDD